MWSVRIRLLCFCFLTFFCKKYESAAPMHTCSNNKQSETFYQIIKEKTAESSVNSILKFLDAHIDKLQFAKYQEVVFVIGGDDSNKIELISLITGADMEVIESERHVLSIVDKDGPLNHYPPNIVAELMPQLLTDTERGVDYYLLPNVNITSDVRTDLTAWHLIQRSIHFATGVKFVLTLTYPPKDENSRYISADGIKSIRHLIRTTNLLINDIEKYSDALCLAVTNVKNNPNKTDREEIQYVSFALRITKEKLTIERGSPDTSPEEIIALGKDINLIETFLVEDTFNRKINIMRLANETGLVSNMTFFQREKVEIKYMVRHHTKYVQKGQNDFSFHISKETKLRLPELINETKLNVQADFSKIDKLIQKAFVNSEEDQFDLSVLLNKMEKGYQMISQINDSDPKSLVEQIITALNGLKMEISSETLDDTLKHVEVYNFLTSLEGQHRKNLIKISVSTTTKYLKESSMWYDFLINLHHNLSEYKVQKNVKDYQEITTMVMELCTIGKDEERNVADIGLKDFLDNIGYDIDPKIENMKVNSFKLQKLKSALHRTMFDYGTHFCSPNQLSVQGYNVKMSDVIKMNCTTESINVREIFVMNNFFIDADMRLVGENLELIIIALRWEIVGSRLIEMIGKSGEAHNPDTAPESTQQNINGQSGKPGKPGFAGGCFMAIGDEFFKDELLSVNLKGGRGGPGQHGGNGWNGQDGEEVQTPRHSYEAVNYYISREFEFHTVHEGKFELGFFKYYLHYQYAVRQKKTENRPGSGGAGGTQGIEGPKGKTFFIGLQHRPSFSVDNERGGKGGHGGKKAQEKKLEQVFYTDTHRPFSGVEYGEPVMVNADEGVVHKKGTDGSDNTNDVGIEQPDVAQFKNPSHVVNRYKSYLRENLNLNFREERMRKFMVDLEANEHISSFYKTVGFAHELQCLENHYLRLRNEILFFPFYESLKNRIIDYEKSTNESADYKKALSFIYASVLKKNYFLINKEKLRNFKDRASIIDLLEYLEIVQKNIRKMDAIEADASISEQTKDYQNSLNDRINQAVDAVNNEVLIVLFQLFEPLGKKIIDLLEEVIIDRENKKQESISLGDEIRDQGIFGVFKILGTVLKLFGEAGKALGSFTKLGVSIYESIAEADRERAKLLNSLTSQTKALKEVLKEPFRLYCQQLDYMSSKIPENSSQADHIKEIIYKHKVEVEEYLDSDSYLNVQRVYEMRRKLNTALGSPTKVITWTEILKKVNEIVGISLEVWKDIKDNEKKLNEMYEKLTNLKNEIKGLDNRIQKILNILFPMIQEVERTMITIADSIANQTQVEIVISAWKVQTAMSDFKLISRQMADGYSMKNAIVRLIEKIEEAFNTMITIYDRIQSYMDQSKLASFVGDLHTNQDFKDPAVKELVTQLKRVLQSNIVMEQYDLAIHSFKQHFFPFATKHFSELDFSSSFQTNDTVVLVRRASEEIDYLEDQLKFLEASIGRYDREIFGQIYFSSNNVGIAKPFYIFRSREYKDLFKKLLSGEEIMVKADIANGLRQNAIKFNEIGIQMRLIEDEMQEEFNAYLQYFGVRMSLLGHMYYRCANHFYYLPVDDNIVIEYSFKKDLNQEPVKYNDVYRKLSEKHFFLSPYATWKIQLTVLSQDSDAQTLEENFQIGFLELAKKFEKFSFNLELVGRGQYFRSNGTLETEICTDEVGKYYEFDNSLSDDLSPQRLKYRYLLH